MQNRQNSVSITKSSVSDLITDTRKLLIFSETLRFEKFLDVRKLAILRNLLDVVTCDIMLMTYNSRDAVKFVMDKRKSCNEFLSSLKT